MHHLRLAAIAIIAALLITSSSGALAKNTGLIFVSFGSLDHLAVVDPKTNTIIKHLKTSRGPHEMHFNADHSRLYVAYNDESTNRTQVDRSRRGGSVAYV